MTLDLKDLKDLRTPDAFQKENPNLFAGKGASSLNYLLRTRHINGLGDCGAVLEPAARRLLINPPKFLEWLLNRKKVA